MVLRNLANSSLFFSKCSSMAKAKPLKNVCELDFEERATRLCNTWKISLTYKSNCRPVGLFWSSCTCPRCPGSCACRSDRWCTRRAAARWAVHLRSMQKSLGSAKMTRMIFRFFFVYAKSIWTNFFSSGTELEVKFSRTHFFLDGLLLLVNQFILMLGFRHLFWFSVSVLHEILKLYFSSSHSLSHSLSLSLFRFGSLIRTGEWERF